MPLIDWNKLNPVGKNILVQPERKAPGEYTVLHVELII